MLKWVSGSIPGKRKPPAASETPKKSRQERDKVYELKRGKRTPQEEGWVTEFPWLRFDNDGSTRKMTCAWCIEFHVDTRGRGTSSFIKGCTNFRKSTLTEHDGCNSHLRVKESVTGKKVTEKGESVAMKALSKMLEAEEVKFTTMFRTAHAIAKHGRPLSDYRWLCSVDLAKGIPIETSHTNEQAAGVFINMIARVMRDDMRTQMEDAKFFSFVMDGASDETGMEQESMYISYAHQGKVTSEFLHIGTPTTTEAQDLFKHCREVLQDNELSLDKLVGITCDGASNMMGSKSGLTTRYLALQPQLFIWHCLCHRLELGFKDAMKKVKSVNKVQQLLNGLYYFYHKSAKQQGQLRRVFEDLGIDGLLPPRAGGTRWVPHLQKAIKALLQSYRAYEMQLSSSSHTNPKANGLARLLKSKEVLACALLLEEILAVLAPLSLKFQEKNISLSDVDMWIRRTLDELEILEQSEMKKLETFLESGEFQGVGLDGRTPQMAYRQPLIQGLRDALTDRLSGRSDPAVRAIKFLNFKFWPPAEGNDVEAFSELNDLQVCIIINQEFGCEQVATLAKKFSSKLPSTDILQREWRYLRAMVYNHFSEKLKEGTLTWADVNRIFRSDFPAILELVDLVLSLPPTSVDCEVAFSHLKLTKTARRSNLNNSTLNDLMKIKLEGASVESFDPKRAISLWWTPSRRPEYKRRGGTQKAKEPVTPTPTTADEPTVTPTPATADEPMVEDETEQDQAEEGTDPEQPVPL